MKNKGASICSTILGKPVRINSTDEAQISGGFATWGNIYKHGIGV